MHPVPASTPSTESRAPRPSRRTHAHGAPGATDGRGLPLKRKPAFPSAVRTSDNWMFFQKHWLSRRDVRERRKSGSPPSNFAYSSSLAPHSSFQTKLVSPPPKVLGRGGGGGNVKWGTEAFSGAGGAETGPRPERPGRRGRSHCWRPCLEDPGRPCTRHTWGSRPHPASASRSSPAGDGRPGGGASSQSPPALGPGAPWVVVHS